MTVVQKYWKLLGESPRRHPNWMPEPSQLSLFDTKEQQLHFKLSLDAPLSARLSPANLLGKQILAGCVSDLNFPITTQRSQPLRVWTQTQPVKSKVLPQQSGSMPPLRLMQHQTNYPVQASIFSSLRNTQAPQGARTWDSYPPPTQR